MEVEVHVTAAAPVVSFSPFGATDSDATGTAGDIPVLGIAAAVVVVTSPAVTGATTIGRHCTIYTPAAEPDCACAGSKRNSTGGGAMAPKLLSRNAADKSGLGGSGSLGCAYGLCG